MARAKKKHEFTSVELYFIQGHLMNMTAEDFARELHLPVEEIQEQINALKESALPNAYDLMGKKENRCVVMTPVASEKGDSHRRGHSKIVTDDCVHVINKNRKKTV